MNRLFLYLILILSLDLQAQSSERYNSVYADFYRAEDLYRKEQYAAARKEFRLFMDGHQKVNDPLFIKAAYYEGLSALELYNNDAVPLLMNFLKNYPESIYRHDVYFRLGKSFYYKKKYEEALSWFNKLSRNDLPEEARDEFFFKIGYANFQLLQYEAARSAFYEVKDGTSQYARPALYYYSYIAYHNNDYEMALQGFLKLQDDEQFGKISPFYIAQIYYLQGKYEEVTQYAPKISSDAKVNEKDMNLIIGDAYYRTGKYSAAIPYLEKYNNSINPDRGDHYRLGYAYYKSGAYGKAVSELDYAKGREDSLGQVAYYHIAESLLKLDNKLAARSAFEGAAYNESDPIISEDALYNYAILSYKLDINPYDEAVIAFERYLNRYPKTARTEDIYQYLVNVYTSTNNYKKALESLDKIPNKDIRLKTAYQLVAFNQGVKYFQAGDYQGAIDSYKLADKYPIDPAVSSKASYWTAEAFFREQKYDDALSTYKSFLSSPSASAEMQQNAHYNTAYAYLYKSYLYDDQNKQGLRKEHLQKSIEAFRLYIQSSPASSNKKADAFLRTADAYYVLKENDQAVKFYNEVLNQKAGFEDQALFYLAKTYGYMSGKASEKIQVLDELIKTYPSSKYLFAAIKEIADTYKSQGKFEQALGAYQRLIDDYPESVLVSDAQINMADIYFKQSKYTKSEDGYLFVLEKYGSDQTICKRAAEGLKDVYVAISKPEKIEDLAARYPCFEFSADDQENLYYLPAMEAYNDSTKTESVRLTEAIPKFEKYLDKFPNGRYKNDVKNYLANCHYLLGNKELAIDIYRETLEGPNTSHTELAATRVSNYLYNNKRYQEVIPYYQRVETVSQNPELVFNAKLGLMRSYFLTDQWEQAASYADKVLSNPQVNNELKLEAHYARGMGYYRVKQFPKAMNSLDWLVKNTTTVRGAEAKYAQADIAYLDGDLTKADQHIAELLKMKPTYNYWVAKSLILRSRIQIQLDDLFAAEKNLQSIIEHYPIADDGIIEEAMELQQELDQLKNQLREIEPESAPEININGE